MAARPLLPAYLLTLLVVLFNAARPLSAQSTEGFDACQTTKVRHFGKVFRDAQARQASVSAYQSGLAYPGDPGIDVTYYGLDLRLTHSPAYLNGAVTITLRAAQASLSRFFLDVKPQLRIDSVKVRGTNQPIAFTRETERVLLTPPQPLSLGQTFSLVIYYQGNPASLNGFGSFSFATHGPTSAPVIWSLSEPYGASDWFPCKDTPADKADSSAVAITASRQFVSVSNGKLTSVTDHADSTRTYRWKNSYPIAQYLISLAMTNYTQYDTPFSYNGQSMPVNHFIYPETLGNIRANLDQTPAMLRIFSDLFGPYPFLREKYGHAQFGWGGGMEHQTISSMGAWNSGIIAHELAHQWFGDKITCRDWQNIWLNEGFASYGEALYSEATAGQAGYAATMNTFLTRARSAIGTLYVKDISNVNSIFNSNRTYAKGASLLHMLRGVLGDEVFFRGLKAYATAPALAYGTAVTEDFQAVMEQVSGRKLDYFFRQWVYGENYPTYRLSWQDNTGSKGPGVQVWLQQSVNSDPASFTMPVQLRVQSAAGDTLVTVFNDQADQTFVLPAKGQPTGVLIDPNNLILKSVGSNTMVVTATEELQTDGLNVYPNPASEQLNVTFTSAAAGTGTLTLLSTGGQVVRSPIFFAVKPGQQTFPFSLRGLPAGYYLLRLTGPGAPRTAQVLVR